MFRKITCQLSSFVRLNTQKPRTFSLGDRVLFCSTLNINMEIGTHDGVFHCDEVLACYMLQCLPQYRNALIVRTRDPNKLNKCDIVVDVGGVFEHDKKRYDHHQREFTETLSSLRPDLGDKFNKIKLSSAGLIYAFYGEKVIQYAAPDDMWLKKDELAIVYKKIYENLIQEVDAIDNGVPMTDTEEPKYKIRTHLSNRVARLNPEWNSSGKVDVEEAFRKALNTVGEEFLYLVRYYITIWLPARQHVKVAIENRFNVHESGKILEFTERFPWKEHLFDLETDMKLGSDISFVLFNDKPDSWRVQAVPVNPTSFITRKPLNPAWWGVRDDDLSTVAGIENCVFCHATGFIGGNKTKEGALRMAISSLNATPQ